jgi:nickel transport protein
MKYVFTISILMAWLLSMAGPGFSHGVSIIAHFSGDEVHTDSYWADGRPISGAEVHIYSVEGEEVVKGSTGEDGAFDTTDPGLDAYKIVLSAPSGHRSETVLHRKTVSSGEDIIESGIIHQDVERALARRLEPIEDAIQDLRRQVQRPGLTEILGGIGWIVGLAGAFLWGASRKKGG